ncbi:Sugar/maltose fermentation stimulation protein homolog [Sporomusa ovata]|uniref:Sugar/maltose fermentation stimulation protein homolog n=2 Tax=Sporomusa ovata TaxID=2378 RepID=A0A0U1KYY0_9FIRM|nr:Sugar/maltose fermentation stimulation protein homolog [Sporomusa ovata]
MADNFVNGVFLEECKHRFLCKVDVNGQEELCYIASSSKLAHFIDLTGREVLLTPNTNKSKTRYTIHAVKTSAGYILLNLAFVNKILQKEFNKSKSIYHEAQNISAEKTLPGELKVDFLIDGNPTIVVEAKAIISGTTIAYVPAMKVKRAVVQLTKLNKLLRMGYSVHYYFVLLSPTLECLQLDKGNKEFYQEFTKCIENGMRVFVYKTVWKENEVSVMHQPIIESSFITGIGPSLRGKNAKRILLSTPI